MARTFILYSSLPKAETLFVSESIKNVADQCHYPELHLEDKGSVAVELMLSEHGSRGTFWAITDL